MKPIRLKQNHSSFMPIPPAPVPLRGAPTPSERDGPLSFPPAGLPKSDANVIAYLNRHVMTTGLPHKYFDDRAICHILASLLEGLREIPILLEVRILLTPTVAGLHTEAELTLQRKTPRLIVPPTATHIGSPSPFSLLDLSLTLSSVPSFLFHCNRYTTFFHRPRLYLIARLTTS